jgi:tellurite resistance protein
VLRDYIHSNLRYFTDATNVERRLDVIIDDVPLAEQRENAYGLALSIAIADGEIDDTERKLIKRLRRALDIDEARAEIVEERMLP